MTKELLSQIANMELRDQLEAERVKVKKLLTQKDIAVKCLKEYGLYKCKDEWFAQTALEQIKELEQ